jgi:Zn finger protein HypA/HybF involved in hydrogenase expression
MKQREVKITDEEIKLAYDKYDTLHQASAELKMTTVSLWRRAKKIGLAWKDKNFKPEQQKIPLNEIIEGKHPYYQTLKLKKRLLKEGVKENKCDICGIIDWNNIELSMQLDHIDGDSHNHKLDNLRMVCPNCHSQTNTYCGKNKKIKAEI